MTRAAGAVFRFAALLVVVLQVFAGPPRERFPAAITSSPRRREQQIRARQNTLSSTIAGAYQTSSCSSDSTDSIRLVSAEWTIPAIFPPAGDLGPGTWSVNHELAIDGVVPGCKAQAAYGGLLMNHTIDDSGTSTTVIQGFYQYFPDDPQFFDVDFAVGDKVHMAIATDSWPPLYTIKNISSNQTASIRASTSQPKNCNKSGAVLVDDPVKAGVPSPLASFDAFTMKAINFLYFKEDCTLDGATLVKMDLNDNVQITSTPQGHSDLAFLIF